MILSSEELIQLLLSLLIGGIIGLEREYSSKAAGFRTMILISIGSTLFTIISKKLGVHGNEDRIAANIITGIGFIGAGVVFKEGFNVTGLTTSAAIWLTAALGMAIGAGEYALAFEAAVLGIAVLYLFEYFQNVIGNLHQKRTYRIIFNKTDLSVDDIKKQLIVYGLKHTERSETKNDNDIRLVIDVIGNKHKVHTFNSYLLNLPSVKSFDC